MVLEFPQTNVFSEKHPSFDIISIWAPFAWCTANIEQIRSHHVWGSFFCSCISSRAGWRDLLDALSLTLKNRDLRKLAGIYLTLSASPSRQCICSSRQRQRQRPARTRDIRDPRRPQNVMIITQRTKVNWRTVRHRRSSNHTIHNWI